VGCASIHPFVIRLVATDEPVRSGANAPNIVFDRPTTRVVLIRITSDAARRSTGHLGLTRRIVGIGSPPATN
jgi:hypothetical protein